MVIHIKDSIHNSEVCQCPFCRTDITPEEWKEIGDILQREVDRLKKEGLNGLPVCSNL